jgi:hypothetical protein
MPWRHYSIGAKQARTDAPEKVAADLVKEIEAARRSDFAGRQANRTPLRSAAGTALDDGRKLRHRGEDDGSRKPVGPGDETAPLRTILGESAAKHGSDGAESSPSLPAGKMASPGTRVTRTLAAFSRRPPKAKSAATSVPQCYLRCLASWSFGCPAADSLMRPGSVRWQSAGIIRSGNPARHETSSP